VHDSDYFCAGERVPIEKAATLPDFKAATPFEQFWSQFDDDHLNEDLSSVVLEEWQLAVAYVILFKDMDAAEVMAQFAVHDLDGDGTVTLEEAY